MLSGFPLLVMLRRCSAGNCVFGFDVLAVSATDEGQVARDVRQDTSLRGLEILL